MLDLRPFSRLGTFANDWLDAHYHFSFAAYHDPDRMGAGHLRVWNDDIIQPHSGFDPHPHRDMEIVTYVRQGAISHQDSLGNAGRTEAGQVQVMSAGTGIRHAEYNHEDQACVLFQIWIMPRYAGVAPRWETRPFPRSHGLLEVLASGFPDDGEVPLVHQDARVLGGSFDKHDEYIHALKGRHAYLVVAKGSIRVGDIVMDARDGLLIEDERQITFVSLDDSELVLVETA